MARVCKKGGHVILVDIVTPEPETAAAYNYYEWLCDRSHTRCLDFEELCSLFRLFGLDPISARTRDIEEELVEWMDFSLTRDEDRAEILRAVSEERRGGAKTGLAPYERGSVLCFRQRDASVVGRKLG